MIPLLILSLISLPLSAPAHRAEADTLRKAPRLIVLPIIFSSPDTRWAGGVLPQYVFYPGGSQRASSVRMDAFYTQNRQFTVRIRPQLRIADDLILVGANLAWKRWPTTFYGIGAASSSLLNEAYTEHLLETAVEVARAVGSGTFLGIRHELRSSVIRDVAEGGVLAGGTIRGSRGGTTSGIGIFLRRDTRDHDFFPTAGVQYQLLAKVAARPFGSDFAFTAVEGDAIRYMGISDRQVVALEAVIRLTAGSPPFQALPGVGSIVRAYPTARYIDNGLIAVQVEYRFVPVIWRVGFAAYVAAAQTAARLSDFTGRDVKFAAGIGLRFRLAQHERISIRWDFGFGREGMRDYLDLGEAF